jgi:hypothetical protein
MAERSTQNLDVSTLTIREAATIYANEVANSGKGLAPNAEDGGRVARSNFVSATVRLAGEFADEPGSAVAIFAPDENGKTGIAKLLEGLPDDDTNVKASMMNLRLVGHHVIKKGLSEADPAYANLPDSDAKTAKNEKIFGRLEPKKAESLIAINPDEDVQREFFTRLAAKTENPADRKAALAAMFLLNTGLRSEVIEQLEPHHYNAEKGALYIPGSVAGTKGNPVNIPLNPMADAIIQEFIQERQNLGLGSDKDGKNRIFFKEGSRSQPGSNLPQVVRMRTQDVTDVMRDIKIDNLTYDVKTDTFYDSLSPEGLNKQVKSGSRLLRNIHATLGESLGIPDHRIAYLEGRSTKSIRKNISTGALEVYQVAFPFAISKLDRDHASVFSNFFIDSAQVSGLDFGRVLDLQKPRVFSDTPGYEGYFDKPAPSDTPPVASSVKVTTDAAEGGISPELLEKLKKNPKQLENYLKMLEAKGVDVSQYRNSAIIATILSTLGGAAKAAMAPLPIVGFEGTRQEMLERGASPEEAGGQALAEELSGPMGIIGPVSRGLADATIAGAEAGLEEQYGYKGPVTLDTIDKIGAGFISGGRFKFPNFASGGFIEKKGD